jgi:hypothetical protein
MLTPSARRFSRYGQDPGFDLVDATRAALVLSSEGLRRANLSLIETQSRTLDTLERIRATDLLIMNLRLQLQF